MTVVVENQLEAYNRKNIDEFMDCYDDKIEVFEFPDKLLFSTHSEMRKHYENLFESYPEINAKVLKRMTFGNYVIDYEFVSGRNDPMTAIVIYEIKGDKITKVWFL